MNESQVLQIFHREEALLEGHFLLSSGLHSGQYMQCARVLQKPALAEKLCGALAKKIGKLEVDVVIGPALGGVIVSHEVGRALGARAIFAERVEGVLTLRRGFELKKNESVLVVEDVITTGKSTHEVIDLVKQSGARLVGVAAMVDRSGSEAGFDTPFSVLLKVEIKTFAPAVCPLCREGKIVLTKPGSRGLK